MSKKITRGPDQAAADIAAPAIPTMTVIPREGGTVILPAPAAAEAIPESDQEKDDAEK